MALSVLFAINNQKSLKTSSNVLLSVEGVLVIRTVSFVKSLSKLSIQLEPSVTGTNSAIISFFSRLCQLMPANHGCACISAYPLAPNLYVLSLCKHLVIKFFPDSEIATLGRNSNYEYFIYSNIYRGFLLWNGVTPLSSS